MRKVRCLSVLLYHGSNVIVQEPKILTNGYYKDFGYGFYCTGLERQARRWALVKKHQHIVNVYEHENMEGLQVRRFLQMTDEWLQFIVNCRRGMEHHYDIVEGPMADDTIWDYVEEYVKGNISKEAFWELAKFRYPTHQIVFCTDLALKTVVYKGSYQV